jgi:hypothetical protein
VSAGFMLVIVRNTFLLELFLEFVSEDFMAVLKVLIIIQSKWDHHYWAFPWG